MKKLFTLAALALVTTGAFAASSAYEKALQEARDNDNAKNYLAAHKSLDTALAAAKTPEEKAQALLGVGRVYTDEKNFAKAHEALQQLVAMKGATKEQKWTALSGISGAFLGEKRFPEARATIAKLVSDPLAPAELRGSLRLVSAESYGSQGQPDVACAEYAKIGEDANVPLPIRWGAYKRAGDISLSQSKWAQARADYDKAARLPGLDGVAVASIIGQIAETYVSQNQLPQARAELTQAEQLVSSLPIQQAAVRLRIVQLYAQENNAEEALKSLNSFGSMMTLRAKEALDKKDYATARESFSAILALRNGYDAKGSNRSPQTIGLLLVIGQMYQFEGNYPKAKEMYYSVVAVNPEANGISKEDAVTIRTLQQSARLDIARALVSQGNSAEAKKAYVALLNTPDLYPAYKKGAEGDLAKLK